MTKEQIDEFIASNSDERVKDYFNGLIDKLHKTSLRNDRLGLLMGILIAVYFLMDKKIISQLNMGPFTLSDVSPARLFIPLIFAYLFLVFATLNAHRASIIKNVRQIGKRLFKLEESIAEDTMYSNLFLRLIMPFSFWEELNSKYLKDGKVGCLTMFLTIPLYLILLVPFAFEFIILKELITKSWNNGWLEKTVIVLTIWILIAVVVYYIKLLRSAITVAQKDLM